MSETVSFPKIGLEFDVPNVAFKIGTFEIYWYGVLITLGIVLALLYLFKRAKFFGVDSDRFIDVLMGGIIGGIIGARLYFVIFDWSTYKDNILGIITNFRDGGLAVYGGLIGGVLAGLLVCKIRKVKMGPALDLAGMGFLIGQCVGRWGNLFNIEAFGSNTTMPWGMTSYSIQSYLTLHKSELAQIGVTVDPSVPVHPTFLYESLWCAIGFILLHFLSKKRRFDGQIFLTYVAWYGLGRIFIEGLRTDSLMLGQIRVSQLLSILMVLAAVIVYCTISLKIKRDDTIPIATLYAHTDAWKAELEKHNKKGNKENDELSYADNEEDLLDEEIEESKSTQQPEEPIQDDETDSVNDDSTEGEQLDGDSH